MATRKLISKPIKSASLIVARKHQSNTSFYNYELLMLQRKVRPPWDSILVFPGGKYDPEHDNFLQQKFNLSSPLQATVLRQCFEETGLYFSQDPILETQKIKALQKIRLDYISRCMDKNDYKLDSRTYVGKLGEIMRPVQNIIPFIRLITIPDLAYRYDTTFFVHLMEDLQFVNFLKYSEHEKYIHERDLIIKCENEFDQFRWMNPSQILHEFFKKESGLAPPQFMMLNVMQQFHKFEQFTQYLKETYQGVNPMKNSEDKSKYKNVSLGPNIVSLINDQGSQTQSNPEDPIRGFKFAATLIGDREFPYEKLQNTQTCESLKLEIRQWRNNRQIIEEGTNRLLFNKPKQFFEDNYEIECDVKGSVLRKMVGFEQIKERLKTEYVL